MDDVRLGKDFWLSEFLRSEAALRHDIDMTPPEAVIENLSCLTADVLQPTRDSVGRPVILTSGYRPPRLNTIVKGSDDSAHIYGRAADIFAPGLTPMELATVILGNADIEFDKVILEFPPTGWVHVQIHKPGRAPRRAAFTAKRMNEKTVYLQGLVA